MSRQLAFVLLEHPAKPDMKRLAEALGRRHPGVAVSAQNGPVLRDGSTFGVSETERIGVRLCVSERFPGLEVIAGSLAATK